MNNRILATVAVVAVYLVGMASLGLILAGTISLVNQSADATRLRSGQTESNRVAIEHRTAVTNSSPAVLAAMN